MGTPTQGNLQTLLNFPLAIILLTMYMVSGSLSDFVDYTVSILSNTMTPWWVSCLWSLGCLFWFPLICLPVLREVTYEKKHETDVECSMWWCVANSHDSLESSNGHEAGQTHMQMEDFFITLCYTYCYEILI